MTKLVACVLAAVVLIACSPAAQATERATPDDTARFLAGLRGPLKKYSNGRSVC